jgi:KDO2-lipid IV(A) lauroyltransferase
MRIAEVAVARTDDRDADVVATTQAVQTAFEGFVRAYPEQWMWAHRRWER